MSKKATRRPPEQRRQEIVDTAVALANTLGLDRVTSRDVANELGVATGLVHHYFPTVDELVVAAFAQAATGQNEQDETACSTLPALDALRALVQRTLAMDSTDARLWMSAWVAAPRRPELAREVDKQMLAALDILTGLLAKGHALGVFDAPNPTGSAVRILTLFDGFVVQLSMRSHAAYGDIHSLIWDTVEREVGLPAGSLRP